MKNINLEIVVFFCGAVVMAYEIIGSRILGPFVGTSIHVWSSIIGIILFSLSIGYYSGGRLADKHPEYKYLAVIILLAGLFILLTVLFKNALLDFLLQTIKNIHLVSIFSSLILFSIPALLLGMVSPFAARLKIRDTQTAGATVGYLYAISTVGSITGTFAAGFFLIPGFRLTTILLLLATLLIILSIFLYLSNFRKLSIQTDETTPNEKN